MLLRAFKEIHGNDYDYYEFIKNKIDHLYFKEQIIVYLEYLILLQSRISSFLNNQNETNVLGPMNYYYKMVIK